MIKEAIKGFTFFDNILQKLWKIPAQTIPSIMMEKKGAITFHVKNNETEKSTRKKINTALSEVLCPKLSPLNQTNSLKRKDKITKATPAHKQRDTRHKTKVV